MSSPVVRAAEPSDAALVLRLIHDSFASRSTLVPPSGAGKETIESVGTVLAVGGAGLAMLEDEPAGAVLWQPRDDSLYLGRLSVLPQFRQRGIAGALVSWVEAAARRLGKPAVTLGVRVSLPENFELFARRGFVEIGRSAHPGWTEPTMIEMRKQLI